MDNHFLYNTDWSVLFREGLVIPKRVISYGREDFGPEPHYSPKECNKCICKTVYTTALTGQFCSMEGYLYTLQGKKFPRAKM